MFALPLVFFTDLPFKIKESEETKVYTAKIAVSAATFSIDKPYSYRVPEELREALQAGMRVLVPFGRGNRRSEGLVLSLGEEEGTQKLKSILSLLDERPVLDAQGIQLALWLRERYFSTLHGAALAMLPTGLWYTLRDRYVLAEGLDRESAFAAAGRSEASRRLLELLYASGGSVELSHLVEALQMKNPKPLLRRLQDEGILKLETGVARKVKDKMEKVAKLILLPEEAMQLVTKRRETAPLRYTVTELLCAIGSATVKELAYFTGASSATLRSLEKSGILQLEEREVFRRELPLFTQAVPALVLNEEQELAASGLQALCESDKATAALLYGVTGSGKTQVYLKLITQLLEQGKTALVLVPEIALTTKLLEVFHLYFREKVAILHSALPATERYDEWKRIRDGHAQVVLGTRSAVFAPLQNLGLIVLDEEQEGSYQSETLLRYHAREVAKYRCVQNKALLLLGSATPAVETMYAARAGQYHLFTLQKRYNTRALPEVQIIDMKPELRAGNDSGLSAALLRELEENFARGEQSILFLNRRGSHRLVSCGECGEAPSCPRCTVYLAHHGANGRLMCHHCGHSEPLPRYCAHCGGLLHFVGQGTQQIEAELARRYPDIELMRMDTDNLSANHSHEAMLERFVRKKIPVLIGTQMVAKGLDFENVTLVGVIAADLSLYINSFRAAERSFSLLTQVVGRAGRGAKTGRALIQSCSPAHEIIQLAAQQDYDSFFENECELRRLQRLPPFGDLFQVTVSGPDEAAVLRVCMNLRAGLARYCAEQENNPTKPSLLGPAPAAILKVNQRYRYHLTLSAQNTKQTRAMLAQLLRVSQADPATRGMSIMADVNRMD